MKAFDYDLGILGGGAAGLTAAAGAAQLGAKTVIIDRAGKLGGDCLHHGCVPSKTLIRSAQVWALARRTAEFGLPPLQLPPVELGTVMDRVAEVIARIQEHDSPERFCRLGAATIFGTPHFLDDHQLEVDGQRLTARSWIIATGSRPALPPVAGLETVAAWTNETVFAQRRLPQRLLVLGGGPIGVELAQAFQRLGSAVTLVEFTGQLLPAEDEDLAVLVQARLEAEGMKVRLNTKALRAERAGNEVRLTVTSGPEAGTEETLTGDALLVAAGRRPNVEGLELEAAGVDYGPGGIPTDARLRTNQKHIYACGDVNGVYPFTHVAGYEAGIALTNSVMHLPRKADYGKVPWCTYCDPELASIGLNEKRATAQGIDFRVLTERFSDNDRALAEGETEGCLKLLVGANGKPLGCQILGHGAGELIHQWVAAFSGGTRLSTLAGAIHPYPTLGEIGKRAAGAYFTDKLFSDRTRTILRLLFQLKGRACAVEEPDRSR